MRPGSWLLALSLLATACASGTTARPEPRSPRPTASSAIQQGLATYYARRFHGRRTASGERMDNGALIAAHRTLPFGTRVRVTNLENGRSVVLRIVDRGPYGANRRKGAIIDVSRSAAQRLDFVTDGIVRVRVEVLGRTGP